MPPKKKQMMQETTKYKKNPMAPKRFKSAFMFYSAKRHQELRKDPANKKLKVSEVAKMVSQSWKSLPDDERSAWQAVARRDRERFEREKAAYKGPWKVPDVKDPNRPKKPVSAFFAFSNQRRKALAAANPSLSATELSTLLSQLWKQCPADVKQAYRDDEAQKREVYKAKVAELKESQNPQRPATVETDFASLSVNSSSQEKAAPCATTTVSSSANYVFGLSEEISLDPQGAYQQAPLGTDGIGTDACDLDSAAVWSLSLNSQETGAPSTTTAADSASAKVRRFSASRMESMAATLTTTNSSPNCTFGVTEKVVSSSSNPQARQVSLESEDFPNESYDPSFWPLSILEPRRVMFGVGDMPIGFEEREANNIENTTNDPAPLYFLPPRQRTDMTMPPRMEHFSLYDHPSLEDNNASMADFMQSFCS